MLKALFGQFQVPLFSTNYLNRVKNYTDQPFYPDSEKTDDLKVAMKVSRSIFMIGN